MREMANERPGLPVEHITRLYALAQVERGVLLRPVDILEA